MQSLTGLNSEFSFSYTDGHTELKELSLSNYLIIAEVGCILFLYAVALWEMQTVWSVIWTQVKCGKSS